MKRINRIVLLLVLLAAILLASGVVIAQDATPEVTETAAPSPEPTVEPAPTEAPDPGIPGVDETQVTNWLFAVLTVLVLGIVAIALVGIIQAAKGLPQWAQALILNTAKTGIDELERIAKGTPNTVDDAAVAELRQRLADLEAALRVVQQKVG